MWVRLKQIYHNLAYTLANKLSYKQNDIKQIALIESLNIALYSTYSANKAYKIILPLIFKDINEYIIKINFCINNIENKKSTPNIWCSYDFYDSRLSLFLLKDGNIIDVKETLSVFKNKVLVLCKLLNEIADSEDLTDQHNLRMIKRFYNHLINIIETLITFSKE